MKTEESIPVEGELMDDRALELRKQSVPATIYQLAKLDMAKGGVSVVEAADKILAVLHRAAIIKTLPDDWTLYKTRDGRITGYLEDQGCKRITKLWRIEVYNLGPLDRPPHWQQISED